MRRLWGWLVRRLVCDRRDHRWLCSLKPGKGWEPGAPLPPRMSLMRDHDLRICTRCGSVWWHGTVL